MSIASRLTSWLRGDDLRMDRINAPLAVPLDQRAAVGSHIIQWQANKPQWLAHDVGTYDAEAYRKVGLIFRCIQHIANAAGSAPLRVYVETTKGQQDEDASHPLRQLMQRPNERQGEAVFLSYVTMVAAISGFCVVEKERDRYGNVIGLWPLRSDWIRPVPRTNAPPDWEYRVPGYQEPFALKAEDVIPLTYADTPDWRYTGIGPLEVLLREVGVSNALTDFVKAFLDRGAMPLYFAVPETEGPIAKQWQDAGMVDAFRRKFRDTYTGLSNATDVMISPAIKDIRQLGFNFNELAYTDLRDVSELAICTTFGVPPILVGARAGLERSTYNNTEQAEAFFYNNTMSPLWTRWDDIFTRHLMPEFEWRPQYSLGFDLAGIAAMQEDENAKHDRARNDFTASLVSRHTAQRLAGLDPHGPDVFLVPFSMVEVPVGGATQEPGDDARALPEPQFLTRDGRAYINERALTPEQRAASDRIAGKNKQQIIRLAGLAEPIVQRFFRAQRDRIVDVAVRGSLSYDLPETRDDDLLQVEAYGETVATSMSTRAIEQIDWDEEDRLLRDALRQWWESVSEVAWADAAALTNTDLIWSISNPFLADLFDVLGLRIKDITETTRRDVERVVREALMDGTTIPDLAGDLRGLFNQTYANRHLAVARTESMHAYSLASQRAYQASGVVSQVMVADNPDHSEPYNGAADGLTCASRNGLVVPVDRGYYHVASDHPNGSACLVPILSAPLGEV